MEILRKKIKVDNRGYYRKHLEIINSVMERIKMTDKEMDIITSFMSVDEALVEGDRFNTLIRKHVMKELGLSHGGLGNHLSSLIKKGFISRSKTGKLHLNKYVVPKGDSQGYQFKLEKEHAL